MKPRRRTKRLAARFLLAPPYQLEHRTLLAGPTAAWLGQDLHDLVGPYPAEIPDGIQDVHILVSNLNPNRQILSADLRGLGGSQWVYQGPYGPWRAALVHADASPTADLFVQPDRVETGRPFNLVLSFDDGTSADLWFDGGAADPSLRMPEQSLRADWIGQQGDDRTGLTASVGPDGIQDAVISLSQLTATSAIVSARVTGPLGLSWVFGVNSQGASNAELVRDATDPSRALLYVSPDRDLARQPLSVEVVYDSGQIDTATLVAGPTDPTRAVAAAPALATIRSGLTATWAGQGTSPAASAANRPAWAGVDLAGLPNGRTVVAASLSADNHTSWIYRAPGQTSTSYYSDPYANSLAFQVDTTNPGRAWIAFSPDSDRPGVAYILRLAFDDGSIALAEFDGGTVDLGRFSATSSSLAVAAAPGADLNALARVYGSIQLSPGTYVLDAPLVLTKPISITAPFGGVTLLFSQPQESAPWTAAIKIHAGNTRLDGFSVRFAGPVRWNWNVSYGPAVIGTTDNFDSGQHDPKANLTLTNLDLQSPPASSSNEEAPRLIRLVSAASGTIAHNRLRGGTIEFLHGPWTITDNTYLGTMPGTWAWDVFAAHFTANLTLTGNRIDPLADSGTTYRFLVLTGTGDGDRIEGNTIRGLGARSDDTSQVNAHELVLTEAYSIHFEGRPLALSSDGRILQISAPQGSAPGTGDVVAIVSGPHAGQWVRIAQAINPTTLLLAAPLPAGDYDVSISSGFVNERFATNVIDARGTSAAGLVLVGNHFGTQVVDNSITGGGQAIRMTAYPSENPVQWGWSHTQVLGINIAGNTIVDADQGIVVSVEHGPDIKSNAQRVYWSGTVSDNTVRWSAALVPNSAASQAPARALEIGDLGSLDPAELRVTLSNNLTAPAAVALVNAGQVNGQELVDTSLPLPLAPPWTAPGLSLVNDTGASNSDGLTSDARIALTFAQGASAYEYRVGKSGNYQQVTSYPVFLPAILSDGPVTLSVRGVNSEGRPGPEATLVFTLDTTAPRQDPPRLDHASDTGRSQTDAITRATTLTFQVSSDADDRVVLLRDGVELARGAAGTLTDQGPVPDGLHAYTVVRTDAAGNSSTSATLIVTVDTKPPGAVSRSSVTSNGVVSFAVAESNLNFEYRVGNGAFLPVPSPGGFRPEGLLFGTNRVEVRATDAAGNISPVSVLVINLTSSTPAGIWVGQDNQDYVGPSPLALPDGIQDIRIQLGGLPAKVITFIDIQGLGGSRWQYNAPTRHWKIALVRSGRAATADLYMQPDRVETGRAFEVRILYADGTSSDFWVNGGKADPKLQVRPVPAEQAASRSIASPAKGARTIGPRASLWLAAWRRKHEIGGKTSR